MIAFLTGAGISVPSGLPTYRGPGGLYEDGKTVNGMPIEEFLSAENRAQNPQAVTTYIKSLDQSFKDAEPNALHWEIAELQKHFGVDRVKIFTQNIDTLHEAAGATQVVHLHGTSDAPVLFGENIPVEALQELINAVDKTRYLIVIGSSVQFDYLIEFISEIQAWNGKVFLLDTNENHHLKNQVDYWESDPTQFELLIKDFVHVIN
jgi:NAD-dependent SIR2 family protein deacetylase